MHRETTTRNRLLIATLVAAIAASRAAAHEVCIDEAGWSRAAVPISRPEQEPTVFAGNLCNDGSLEVIFDDRAANVVDVITPSSGASVSFTTPVLGGGVVAGATGDVNGDTVPDLVLAMGGDIAAYLGPRCGGPYAPGSAEVIIHRRTFASANQVLGDHGALRIGDLSGDGIDDIAWGDYTAECSSGGTQCGQAGVVFGQGTWTPGAPTTHISLSTTPPDFLVYGATPAPSLGLGDRLGRAIDIADVDLDGSLDLLVGIPNRQVTGGPVVEHHGQVQVFYGPLAVTPPAPTVIDLAGSWTWPHLTLTSTNESDEFGRAIDVATGPDFASTVVLGGAPRANNEGCGVERAGAVYGFTVPMCHYGGPGAPCTRDSLQEGDRDLDDVTYPFYGEAEDGEFGSAIASGEFDPNDNGYWDVVIGAPGSDEAWVIAGPMGSAIDLCDAPWGCGAPGLVNVTRVHHPGAPADGRFGESVDLGDFGLPDCPRALLVGATRLDGIAYDQAAGYLYEGCNPCVFSNEPPLPVGTATPSCSDGQLHAVLDAGNTHDTDDVDEGALTYLWSLPDTNACPGTFDDPSAVVTTFRFDFGEDPFPCDVQCDVQLTVFDCRHDGETCDAPLTCPVPVAWADGEPPVFGGIPAAGDSECDAPDASGVTAIDACRGSVTPTVHDEFVAGSCGPSGTLTRTWTATDSCGNTATEERVYTIVDDLAPVISDVPEPIAVECGDAIPDPPVTVTDACDPAPRLDDDLDPVLGVYACPIIGKYQRTWTATDACGNSSTATQLVTIVDTEAPELLGVPANATYECADPGPATVTATDGCDGDVDVELEEVDDHLSCPRTITRTWTATDSCGNGTSAQQVVTIHDTTPPVLAPIAESTMECGDPMTLEIVEATDNCDSLVDVTFTDATTPGRCAGESTITRTYTAVDDCSNSAFITQVIHVQDTRPPVIVDDMTVDSCLWPPNHSMHCFALSSLLPHATDVCSSTITYAITGCSSSQDDDGLGDGATTNDCQFTVDQVCVRAERTGRSMDARRYQVSVTATDDCGNASTAVMGVIVVPHDMSRSRGTDCVTP